MLLITILWPWFFGCGFEGFSYRCHPRGDRTLPCCLHKVNPKRVSRSEWHIVYSNDNTTPAVPAVRIAPTAIVKVVMASELSYDVRMSLTVHKRDFYDSFQNEHQITRICFWCLATSVRFSSTLFHTYNRSFDGRESLGAITTQIE